MIDNTYNGYKNYETWNVSLWLANDYPMYSTVKEWVEHQVDHEGAISYEIIKHSLTEMFGPTTPDGVYWVDPIIDVITLTEELMEFV